LAEKIIFEQNKHFLVERIIFEQNIFGPKKSLAENNLESTKNSKYSWLPKIKKN